MARPEEKVRRAVRRWLNALAPHGKFVAYAAGPYGQRGVGDFFGCYKGRFISIEVKAPGKEATALQHYTLTQWREAGGLAFCVNSVEQLEGCLRLALGKDLIACPTKSSKSKSPSLLKPSDF